MRFVIFSAIVASVLFPNDVLLGATLVLLIASVCIIKSLICLDGFLLLSMFVNGIENNNPLLLIVKGDLLCINSAVSNYGNVIIRKIKIY